MKTFQTVGMDLSTWRLVDEVMAKESLTIGEAMERLVRHGSIRISQLSQEVTV
jgi:hypothetical protein